VSKRLAPTLLGLLVLSTASGVALAEPSPKDRAEAKGDWTHGRQLMAVKNYDEAVDAFQKAAGLDPKAQYKLDLARALTETGKLVEAEKLYEEILKTDEPNTEKEKAAAKSSSDSLVPRIPTLKIVVVGPDEDAVTATIDGKPAKVGVEIREDPGTYEVEGKADKFETIKKKASVAEGEKFELNLKFKPSNGSDASSEGGSSSHGGNMIPAGIAFGVGGTGILLGTIFGILAFTTTSDLQSICKNNLCPPSAADDINTTTTYGDVSTGMFVVGGVGITLGIIFALTIGKGSSKPDEKKPEKAFIVPYAWPGGVGVTGRF